MYTQEEINLIVLSGYNELTYNAKTALLSKLASAEPDFAGCKKSLIKTLPFGVYNKLKGNFYDKTYREKTVADLKAKGITCVTYFSEGYPEMLRHTAEPPLVLYCKGNISLLSTRCFSIVGSRRTPAQSIAICKKLAGEISRKFTVVSGLAEGADAAALEGALPSGNVISVLAYGYDYVYPAVNANLLKRVESGGLLITEHEPSVAPKGYLFPARNRIIAGLSEGTLVVSAGKKSGALITADYALEYGRDVFALPYPPGSAAGQGCNALIKEGAYLTENILDIFSVFGLDFNSPEQKTLTDEESTLLKAVREAGEAFVPALAEKLGKPLYALVPQLTALEIKGYIVRLGGNRYAAV